MLWYGSALSSFGDPPLLRRIVIVDFSFSGHCPFGDDMGGKGRLQGASSAMSLTVIFRMDCAPCNHLNFHLYSISASALLQIGAAHLTTFFLTF
jgi:hypothetical protein